MTADGRPAMRGTTVGLALHRIHIEYKGTLPFAQHDGVCLSSRAKGRAFLYSRPQISR